jgi:probable F420-dependent oxidoreductase
VAVTLSGLHRVFADDFRGVLELARIADDVGVDQLVVPDHVVMGERVDRYPYGRFPYGPEEPWPEPLTLLTALAAVTSRVRLATGILIAPLRPAPLLAKTVATLDVLSNGRLDLGIGSGWQREEYDASGLAFVGRTAHMDDLVRACRTLWRDAPASFSSPTISFDRIWCRPAPVQPEGPPLWFAGAGNEATARRVAELGTGWLPIGGIDHDELVSGVLLLRKAFADAGRDVAGLGVRAGLVPVRGDDGRADLDRTLAAVPELLELGATAVSVASGPFVRAPDDVRPFLERVGKGSA